MLIHRRWLIALVLVACTTLATIAEAQLKMPFKRRTSTTASTSQNLALTQADGPWLVMCASFTGERGVQQALQLATELRNDHGLEAYLFRQTFDHSGKVQGSGWAAPADAMSLPVAKEWKSSSVDAYEEIAVVVGDFATLEDHQAQTVLHKIRTLAPRSLVNDGYNDSTQSLEQKYRTTGKGPLAAAFLMPNPLLPTEFFKARDLDKIVLKMNKGVKYSLLKCPGQFSVRVATFAGDREWNVSSQDIVQKKNEMEEQRRRGKAVDSELMDAAYKANVLCRALRKKGVEAWEFHDRHESYVCVGSFDWATQKDQSGKDHLNPEIVKIIQQYKGTKQQTHMGTVLKQRTISAFKDHDIHFDGQPMPIVVPKQTARTGRRGLFGR